MGFFCNFAVDKNKEPFKDYYYEGNEDYKGSGHHDHQQHLT